LTEAPDHSNGASLFHIGETVATIKEGKVSRATILDIRIDDHDGEVVYDLGNELGADDELGARQHELFALEPLVAGQIIHCRFNKNTGVWSPVVVRTVRPDGFIDIQYSDHSNNGKLQWAMDVKSAKYCHWGIGPRLGAG
jgi:hypothetical protein